MATPALVAHNVRAALSGLPKLMITADTTAEEADAAFRQLTSFNQCSLNLGRFSGRSPWERHPNGDELFLVLEGEVDVTVLTNTKSVYATVRVGSIFVVPRGLWHRQFAPGGVTALYATPRPTEVSLAEDPRAGSSPNCE